MATVDTFSMTGQITVNLKAGINYIVIWPGTMTAATGVAVPFTITLYTFCDNFCMNPNSPTPAPACKTCGNGILEDGEQCDNGNRTGCINCFIGQGYNCYGPPGGSSYCLKTPLCGDAIVDQGEQCDNGNKTGCTTGCAPDAGYKCTAVVGNASICGMCGNGIVEPGE